MAIDLDTLLPVPVPTIDPFEDTPDAHLDDVEILVDCE